MMSVEARRQPLFRAARLCLTPTAPGATHGEAQSRGYSIVKVTRIVPGNALTLPALIGRVQSEFQEALAEEYARQFLTAIRAELGVKRNEEAIADAKKRITGG